MSKPNLIAISGKINSGKDTVARMIQYLTTVKGYQEHNTFEDFRYHCEQGTFAESTHDYHIKKFALKLKQCCSLILGIPVEDFEKREVKDRLLGEEWRRYMVELNPNTTHFRFPNGVVTKWYSDKEDCLKETRKHRLHPKDWRIVENTPTVRQFLMEFATEAARDIVHPNIWVNALFADYKSLVNLDDIKPDDTKETLQKKSFYPNWIITDLRFKNEYKAVKDHGGITIRVKRDVIRTENKEKGTYTLSANPENLKLNLHPSETELDDVLMDYTILNNGTLDGLLYQVKEILQKLQII